MRAIVELMRRASVSDAFFLDATARRICLCSRKGLPMSCATALPKQQNQTTLLNCTYLCLFFAQQQEA